MAIEETPALSSHLQEALKNDDNPTLFFTGILLCFIFLCFIIYILYDCRKCTAKGNSSEDELCGQLSALESPVKLKYVDLFLLFSLFDHKLTFSEKETQKSTCQSNILDWKLGLILPFHVFKNSVLCTNFPNFKR